MNQTDDDNSMKSTEQLVEELLTSYFTHRDNLPRDGYIAEPKTTQQICDELLEMYPLTCAQVATWMLEREFHPTTLNDGTVAWAIWRMV